jgi:hypothetical protein
MMVSPAKLALGGAILLAAMATSPSALGEDFLSALFGAFGAHRPQPPMTPLPYAGEGSAGAPDGDMLQRARPPYASPGGSQAYCVRTCDGRYFPISNPGNQSRAASCSSFCPASETKVVFGGNIDSAVTESGKPYSELPNAFRYRNELVAGCTCNGKDPVGLAAVKIENDATLRRGDIVAGADGLMVAGRGADRRGASLDLAPAPEQIRSHYRRVPVVAAQ